MTIKAKQLAVRLKPETRDALEAAAEKDMRTLSSLTEKILTEWLREQGFLSHPDGTTSPVKSGRGKKPG